MIMVVNKTDSIRMNLGCGTHAPQNWMNYDSSWRVYLDKVFILTWLGYVPRFAPWVKRLDVTRPLPFKSSSVDFIYSSHMIEHLPHKSAQKLLKECYRILKPSGRIRILTPNLYLMVQDYLSRRQNSELQNHAADHFMKWTGAFEESDRSLFHRLVHFGKNKNLHHWLYDEHSLKAAFEESGFKNVVSSVGLTSDFPDLELLEPKELAPQSTCTEGFKI